WQRQRQQHYHQHRHPDWQLISRQRLIRKPPETLSSGGFFYDNQNRRMPPMTRFPLVALGVSTLLLQPCVLAPGMHMDTDRLVSQDSAENSRVEMVQMTPKRIAQDLAVKSQAEVPPALLDYVPENYRIGPNAALFITVWDHPELTVPGGQQQTNEANARVVRDDGTLFYPFIGNVQVA